MKATLTLPLELPDDLTEVELYAIEDDFLNSFVKLFPEDWLPITDDLKPGGLIKMEQS